MLLHVLRMCKSQNFYAIHLVSFLGADAAQLPRGSIWMIEISFVRLENESTPRDPTLKYLVHFQDCFLHQSCYIESKAYKALFS